MKEPKPNLSIVFLITVLFLIVTFLGKKPLELPESSFCPSHAVMSHHRFLIPYL